jgi:hypothetical protein
LIARPNIDSPDFILCLITFCEKEEILKKRLNTKIKWMRFMVLFYSKVQHCTF